MDASAIRRMMMENIEAAVKAQMLWKLTPRQVAKTHKLLFGTADARRIRILLERNKEDKE